VDFIDDIDFIAPFAGRKSDFLAQIADIIDSGVRRRVDLDQIEIAPFIDRDARGAGVAWARIRVGMLAVDGFRQQARGCGFARPSGSAEKIGVPNAPGLERVAERAGDMLLSDHLIEQRRTPFQIQCLFGQGAESSCVLKLEFTTSPPDSHRRFRVDPPRRRVLRYNQP
jgi:hypothetical protein